MTPDLATPHQYTNLVARLRRIAFGEWTLKGDEGYLLQAADIIDALVANRDEWMADRRGMEARAERAEAERDALQGIVNKLETECFALRQDAERYRRLRNRGKDMSVHVAVLTKNGGYCPRGEDCDAAIDAALANPAATDDDNETIGPFDNADALINSLER